MQGGAAVVLALAMAGPAAADTALDIDTAQGRACVLQDGIPQACFSGISVGRFGVSADKSRGDGRTPLGRFHIAWIRRDSRFGEFFGIDYPDMTRAERALEAGRIPAADFARIAEAHAEGRLPPQDTVLGGYLGIHGVGAGDPWIHQRLNWTNGCVAIADTQLRRLTKWVYLGMPVRIH
jgi:hypothetical protein